MLSARRRLLCLVFSIVVLVSACTASIGQDLARAPDPVQVAVSEFVSVNSFRNETPVSPADAECISGRLVGRLGRDRLAGYGLSTPADTERFFQASIFWPPELGSAFDRVVTGCLQHLAVRSTGASFASRIANAYVTPTEGEEYCMGEWLMSNELDAATAPLPRDTNAIVAAGDEALTEAVLTTTDAVGSCLGLGRAVLTSYQSTESLRPASVDCLLERTSDHTFAELIELATPLPGPDPDIASALFGYLSNCMTDQEVATVVGVS
jgi:hypothetical protein